MNPSWSNTLSVTEPRAVASGISAQSVQERFQNSGMVNVSFDPAHYRSRFCNVRLVSGESVHFSETLN
jgi:hypothetical protein